MNYKAKLLNIETLLMGGIDKGEFDGYLSQLRQDVWDENLYHESINLFRDVAADLNKNNTLDPALCEIISYWTFFCTETVDWLVSHDSVKRFDIEAELQNIF